MINLEKKQSQKGFTLVEVIVVAIIVAALAGVAIPMYTSYVKTSHTNASANAAGSVASFMGSCINQTGTVTGAGVTAGAFTAGTATIQLDCTAAAGVVSSMQLPANIKFNISALAATGSVKATHTAGGDTTSYSY
jgi:prepilin-type N-terminal cleavage/methylation domain-containing protein